ncbi:GMC oxidoreductase [Glycomyces harbinensis]|uniref:Cholesterol oxidase n=1 Tax=Glycomyces harbinensis TaxID=58114 RepID=A0A1G6ZKX7_9ACTN|nr:GMC family oxidoreductase [Glycomyces harbinensis]SDE03424.1 cholesterol oxidase [Glycomyces harbinensis]
MTEPFDADAIVVGSGFGGAVAAARLAQAGFTVIVLERGRRWRPGGFPRRPDLKDGWMWDVDQGLYDIRWLDTMASVQAAGWGGGSLAYANVFARPFAGAMDERWPAGLRRERLDPYYDLAAHMLDVAPVQPDPGTGRPPPRTELVEAMVRDMAMAEATVRPNLAVTFGDPHVWRPNRHGVSQRGCSFTGECVIGCNQGAKNTLDHNYLAVAERHGARAVTDAEVQRIEPRDGGYLVSAATPSDRKAPLREWTAPRVVLAAGAVATNELLLRARDVHGTLPGLSPQLGRGFSGNGDFLTLARLREGRGDMTTGPTITTTTVLDVPEGKRSVWYQVQDGAIPPQVEELLDTVLPGERLRERRRRRRIETAGRSFAVLGMGRDSGDGTLRLNDNGRATLSWRNSWQAELYRSQLRLGPMLGRLLNARLSQPLTWSLLRRTVTVHPLGGVRPGPDAATGVVDEAGEVHGHPGLFVMDGSVLPAATGVNPSATILAVAERSVEAMIRRSGLDGWRAPEWDAVATSEIPEDEAFTYMSERHAATKGDGVVFHERMATRRRERARAVLELTAEIPGMDRFLADPSHTVPMRGVIDIEGLASRAAVTGTLSLFPDGRPEAMAYDLRFDDDTGRPWRLTGVKATRSRTPIALLTGLTNLRTAIAPADAGPVETQRFTVSIGPFDLLRLATSIAGQGFTRARRIRAAARFAAFFARAALLHQNHDHATRQHRR